MPGWDGGGGGGGERGQVADLADRRPLQRLGPAGQHDQPGDRGLGGGDAGRDGAAEAVAGHEDAGGVDGGVGLEQADGGEGIRQVLVGHGEGAVLADQVGVGVRDLVEPEHGDAAAGEAPREVLERLAPADAAVAVLGSRAAEEHQRRERPGRTRQAERAGHGQRPRAEGHVGLVEAAGVGVAGRLPRRGGLGVAGRRELDAGQLAVPGQVHRQRLLAALEGHRDLHGDHGAVGRIAGRGADRGELTALGQHGLPGRLQPGGGDHRPQPGGEQLADLVELPRPGQVDDGQRPPGLRRRSGAAGAVQWGSLALLRGSRVVALRQRLRWSAGPAVREA